MRAGEALRLAGELNPEMVILDPDLEGESDGWRVCRELKSLENPPKVLIYTACNSRESIAAARFAGADSYLCKRISGERLPEVVDGIRNGQRMWFLCNDEDGSENGIRTKIEQSNLTPRQKEIAALAMSRHTNEEIARELLVSVNTVKAHIKNILRELNLDSRQGLFRDSEPA